MLNKELVKYNEVFYWIFRKIPLSKINEKYHSEINMLLPVWNCDLVLKSNNTTEEEPYFLFLRKIDDVKIENPD